MLNPLKTLWLSAGVLALSACGFHFQNGELIPQELQTLKLESSDPYSDMALSMRRQLQLNNVNLVEDQTNVPVLRLNKISSKDQVVSIFKQGREAEKQLILEVEIVGLLAAFAFFVGPVMYLCQRFVAVGIGVDIGIPAVRLDFL